MNSYCPINGQPCSRDILGSDTPCCLTRTESVEIRPGEFKEVTGYGAHILDARPGSVVEAPLTDQVGPRRLTDAAAP